MKKNNNSCFLRVLRIGILVWVVMRACEAAPQPQELRVGVLRHGVKSRLHQGREKGYDLNVEYLFPSFQKGFWALIGSPRFHGGGSLNTRGGTHQFYGGLNWHFPVLQRYFCEVSLGGEIHNGVLKDPTHLRKIALGSRCLFRESMAFGVIVSPCWTVSVLLDHASNERVAQPNPGLTNFGVRLGYKI